MNELQIVPSGVLLVDKDPGMTSHDVVAIARKAMGIKKIGHCGTLDPMATGLLMLVVGRATKIQDLLMSEDKEYVGTVTLGATTSTQDAEGEILEEWEVPNLSEAEVTAAFDKFTGQIEQMPSMVSAASMDCTSAWRETSISSANALPVGAGPATATSSAPKSSAIAPAWRRPMTPPPTMASRTGFIAHNP